MTVILGLAQLLIISYITVFEYKRRSASVFLWATLLIMFGVMHMVSCLFDLQYSSSVLNVASLFVIGFCLTYLLVRYVRFDEKSDRCNAVFDKTDSPYKNHRLLTIILIVVSVSMILNTANMQGGLLNTSWSGARESSMYRPYVSSENIQGYLYAALAGVPLLCLISKEYISALCGALAMFALLIVTRNRVLMLPIFICIITYIIHVTNVKLTLQTIILGVLGASIILYIVYAVRAFRWMGSLQDALNNGSISLINEMVRHSFQTDDGELGLRKYFYQFISADNSYQGFGKLSTYVRMLLVYIPTRFSFGLKPSDFAETMALAVGGTSGGSIHPTLFGDCYANCGSLGFLLGLLWGTLVNLIDLLIGRMPDIDSKRLAYVTAAFAFVVIGRGAVYNGFINIAWGFPIIYVIYIIRKINMSLTYKSHRHRKSRE